MFILAKKEPSAKEPRAIISSQGFNFSSKEPIGNVDSLADLRAFLPIEGVDVLNRA